MNMHIALCLLTRKAFLILVSLAFFTFSASAQRMMKTINDGWDFRKDGETRWQPINLPHTFNLDAYSQRNYYQGKGEYRKKLSLSEIAPTKRYYLKIDAASKAADVKVNGQVAGSHAGGYSAFILDVTGLIRENNEIEITVDNARRDITPLWADFTFWGGIYRDVWLITTPEQHFNMANYGSTGVFVSTPVANEREGVVQVKAEVTNDADSRIRLKMQNRIYDAQGKLLQTNAQPFSLKAGETATVEYKSDVIDNPQLWTPEMPTLYRVVTAIVNAKTGEVLDEISNKIGFRWFSFDADKGFSLNGKPYKLRGVNRHQEYPYIGYALSDNAQYRDAYKIKKAGFDYVRLSHYPHSPAFMDACDELGLVVADAILGWQYFADNDAFRNQCYRSARQLVRRDRNHPCVMAWEVSLNETKMPIDFMEVLDSIVHKEYPGENVYSCGWMPEVYDIYFQARQHRILHKDRMTFDKPYIVSEYGDWEYYSNNAGLNQHKMPKNMRLEFSSRQFRKNGEERLLRQARNVQEAHNDNMNIPATGDGYWVMFDYNRGYHDDIEASGVMDIFRLPKFAYYFYSSQRDMKCEEDCVLKIASYWNSKSPTDVKVFSNADEVELYLNGKLIGRQKPDSDAISTNLKHPPFTFKTRGFEKGELRAVAFCNGKKVLEDSVVTPQAPVKLHCDIDISGKPIEAGCNDVAFVYISARDENGTVNPDYEEFIDITLPEGIELMNRDGVKAEAGIATALIRIGERKGKARIIVSDGQLKGDMEVEIR